MKPRWMRMNVTCPDCGLIIRESGAEFEDKIVKCFDDAHNFDCPRCKVNYSGDDFWESYHDKQAHVWSHFNGESAAVE